MVKTPGRYFTNTEIEQVFKHIVEGEMITMYIKKNISPTKGEIFNPYLLFKSFLSALNLINFPKVVILKCYDFVQALNIFAYRHCSGSDLTRSFSNGCQVYQCWSNKGKLWF